MTYSLQFLEILQTVRTGWDMHDPLDRVQKGENDCESDHECVRENDRGCDHGCGCGIGCARASAHGNELWCFHGNNQDLQW